MGATCCEVEVNAQTSIVIAERWRLCEDEYSFEEGIQAKDLCGDSRQMHWHVSIGSAHAVINVQISRSGASHE